MKYTSEKVEPKLREPYVHAQEHKKLKRKPKKYLSRIDRT